MAGAALRVLRGGGRARSRSMLPLAVCLLLVIGVTRCQHRNSNSCPFNTMCTCQWSTDSHVHDIVCLGVPLSKLPELPRGHIDQVDIADSGLGALQAEPLSLTKIASLRLMSNNIKHIDDRAFSAMTKSLVSLDLAYNDLVAVPFNAFRDLQTLQWLNLMGNQISNVHGDWSRMQSTLTSLLIGENDLSSLPGCEWEPHQDTLSCMRDLRVLGTLHIEANKLLHVDRNALPRTLQTLSLSQNLLRDVPIHALDNLPLLQWVDLRANRIHKIPDRALPHTLRLEKLDLGENNVKYLPRTLFNGSVHVRDLILDFNRIEAIPGDAFNGLECGRIVLSYNQIGAVHGRALAGVETTLEYLDLEHNRLLHVPVNAFAKLTNLKYLYLSANLIGEIPATAFSAFAASLRALSLSGNLLTAIPAEALANCSQLSHLNLGYNQILEVGRHDLRIWANNLNTLLLRSNRITDLDENVFNLTKNLRELSLSFNPLNYLHPSLFRHVTESLQSLEISFALAEEQFPTELLKPLVNLIWLAIDNNNIDVLPKNSLDSFNQLEYLTLESNKIRAILPHTFKADVHTQLADLRLANNRLEVLESRTFTSLPNIRSISLHGNRMTTIRQHGFDNMTNLVKIVLANNLIKDIQHDAFSNLPVLTKLDLQQNHLFSFSMDALSNSSSAQHPVALNLSHNDIFEILPPKDILHVRSLDLNHNNLQVPPKFTFEKLSNSLRRLYLSYNRIESLELEAFGLLEELEELTLRTNNIENVKKHAFVGLDSLQILDLACNNIEGLHVGQFSYLQQLRVLDLSNNRLRYLPKDIFRNTKIEKLQLSSNAFATIPTAVLTDIGITLRDLSISMNHIEHIDSTMFPTTPYLLNLDLSHNRLNLLPDNVFTSLGHLQRLDLGSNPLRANYKELFHYAQSLKDLSLANIGMRSAPTLPLPNLIYLNISSNQIEEIPRSALKGLGKLRSLDLRNNHLRAVPAHVWNHLPLLKTLQLSQNPIKEITAKCFYGLSELQHLHLDTLPYLEQFDADALAHLHILTSLTIQVSLKINLKKILSNVTSLQTLSLEVRDAHLAGGQLRGAFTDRIRHLAIWGRSLRTLDRDVFAGLEHNAALLVEVRDTQLEELPSGLISNLHRVPHLRLDLRHNQLMSLTPDVFYTNMTTWESLGTKLIAGGLLLEDNPWTCDCRLVWLGHWLRRWLRESLQVHTMDADSAQMAHEAARQAFCTHPDTGVVTAIVDLRPEHMACHASALSNAAARGVTSPPRPHLLLLFASGLLRTVLRRHAS